MMRGLGRGSGWNHCSNQEKGPSCASAADPPARYRIWNRISPAARHKIRLGPWLKLDDVFLCAILDMNANIEVARNESISPGDLKAQSPLNQL